MSEVSMEALEEILFELKQIIDEIKAQKKEDSKTEIDLRVFFDEVRPLFKRLSTAQVEGMEAKLKAFREAGFPLAWAAYAMATSYHETAKRMQPVREGLDVSDTYRKRNFRYYPHYGRGDVQLTWPENYAKMDEELGLNGELVENLDLALDKDISARILVVGMKKGLFSRDRSGPHSLPRHLPSEKGTKAQFAQARRIVNLMDKADMIADYAVKFQAALEKAGYSKEV